MPTEVQQSLIQAVHEHLTDNAQVHFTTSPALICGLELEVQGQKIAWHLAHYIDRLEEQFTALLGQAIEPKAAIAL